MNKYRFLCVPLLLMAASIVCSAAELLTGRTFRVTDGMLSSFAHHVVQDSQGYIWMATEGGLSRFDGYEFLNYPTVGTENGMFSGSIGTLHIDEHNQLLWIRTATFNYACYDMRQGKFVNYWGDCDPQKRFQRFIVEKGGIWMYEENSGLRHVTCSNGILTCKDYTGLNGRLPKVRIRRLIADDDGIIWVTTQRGLYRIVCDGTLETMVKDGDFVGGCCWKNRRAFIDSTGRIIVFNDKGSIVASRQVATRHPIEGIGASFIWNGKWMIMANNMVIAIDCKTYEAELPQEIQMDRGRLLDETNGNYWVSDHDCNLYLFAADGKQKRMQLLDASGYSAGHSRRYSVAQGTDGLFYIATFGNGLFVYNHANGMLTHHSNGDGLLASDYIDFITADRQGNLWACQLEAGVTCIAKQQQLHTLHLLPRSGKQGQFVNAIELISMQADGVIHVTAKDWQTYRFNPEENTLVPMGESTSDHAHLDSITDAKGRVWVATWEKGLLMNDGKRQHQFLANTVSESRATSMVLDKRGTLWIGTQNGLYCVDTRKAEVTTHEFLHYGLTDGLPTSKVECLLAATDGNIWVGATGIGAIRCSFDNHHRLTIRTVSTKQGLTDNNVHSLTQDHKGYIWAGTENAISRINPDNLRATSYQVGNSWLNSINSNACAITCRDGRLLFGTRDGLNVVTPPSDTHVGNQPNLTPLVTNLYVNGVSVLTTGYDACDNVFNSGSIELPHDHNSLTFRLSSLNYSNPKVSLYQYRLEGYDRDWCEPTTNASAEYGNLPPGKYEFRLRHDEQGGETTLSIRILQPWWNTIWAWCVYLLTLATVVYYIYRNARERLRLHEQVRLEKEMSAFRVEFFTQVAHEFRTPLAIISGAVDKIAEVGTTPKKPLQTAQRGIRRLSKLVTHLMEFRKVNTGNLRLQVQRDDLVAFVRDIYQDFWNSAQMKEQNMRFVPFERHYEACFDHHIIDTIVHNLLSNAVKYTPQDGQIQLRMRLDDQWLSICVEDSGPGISIERQQQLFQPFMHGFASQGGMGIGLYTAYKMALTHKGSLTYSNSETLGGSMFTLTIPADERFYSPQEYVSAPRADSLATPTADISAESITMELAAPPINDYRVAIIEDDPDMLDQIKTELSQFFLVTTFSDGQTAISGISKERPDLVLCDVMLPDVSGYDIVRHLKAEQQCQQLPIIMLTALDDERHQISGYEAGADDYITKPCNYRILVARIAQLIRWNVNHSHSSDKETEAAVDTEQSPTDEPVLTSHADRRFLDNMEQIIAAHISDSDFTIDQLAELLKMGRTKVYGKVKELTGLSPNKLLMRERMQRAAQLLNEGELNVSEVSYQVGFKDVGYFIKCFKQHYGMLPNKYKHQ